MPNSQHAIGLAAFLLLTGVTAEAHAQRAQQAPASQATVDDEAPREGSGEGLDDGETVDETTMRPRQEQSVKRRRQIDRHEEQAMKR
jgi:hypothetical protein